MMDPFPPRYLNFVLASEISGGNKKRKIASGWKFTSELRFLGGKF
jgi:hypothetical protein